MEQPHAKRWKDPRVWVSVVFLAVATFLNDSFESLLYYPLAHIIHVHRIGPHILGQRSYGTLMVVRLLWDLLLWAVLCLLLRRRTSGFPLRDPKWIRSISLGLATGLIVMLAAILGIIATRAATVEGTGQAIHTALGNGGSWLILDFVGALGEELYGRAILLITAQRLLGWKGAVLISGIAFSGLHLQNPGASRVWLLRLFLQGCLLAYAVFRTRSLWWSVGYHTGWNWISAPLFGAAGSGYLDEGHIFTFQPHGSIWLTGGSVGPEGSAFAFVAVLLAFTMLVYTTENGLTRVKADRPQSDEIQVA